MRSEEAKRECPTKVELGMSEVTLSRLQRAINTTAYVMVRHDLPQLLPTLKRLEAARDGLLRNDDAIGYAKRVLDQGAMSGKVSRKKGT